MNMKRTSAISIDFIRLYAHTISEKDDTVSIDRFPYDDRHDFYVDETFGGIAAQIKLSDNRNGRRAQSDVSLTVVDVSTRCEVAFSKIKVNLDMEECCKDYYVCFPAETSELKAGHTYRLIASDDTASQTLATSVFHLFGASTLGHPTEWYEVCNGGIRPAWENNLYKTTTTVDHHDYYVRFNLSHRFGAMPPAILPELEMRLHYPDGRYVSVLFREPKCLSPEDFDDNNWFVEYPFTTTLDINGVFYAELLCMEFPIA